ncbi:MAG: tetratricopeptide repeat protein [Planctomycetes bacterium]|nr:tetratricopeptide repeat protein [Planctomycetota bacterium]
MTEPESQPAPQKRRPLLPVAVVVIAVAGVVFWFTRPEPLPDGVGPEIFAKATEQFRNQYDREPDRIDVLSFAGELAAVDGRNEDAAACFAAIPSEHPEYGLSARLQEGYVLLKLNRAAAAEKSLREFLTLAARTPGVAPEHVFSARKQLAFLLSVELRIEERQSVLRAAHESGAVDVFDSKQFFFPHLLIWNSETGSKRLARFLEVDPTNRLLRLAEARYVASRGQLEKAIRQLDSVLGERPDDVRAASALLECFFDADDWVRFNDLYKMFPDYQVAEPWLMTRMRGHREMHNKDWETAAERFRQVLAADGTNPWAQSGLARALKKMGKNEAAEEAAARSAVIAKIRVNLGRGDGRESLEALAQDCENIGLPEAAAVFRQHAKSFERK